MVRQIESIWKQAVVVQTMSEYVACACQQQANSRKDKSEGVKWKEKFRLFHRKKTDESAKCVVCPKCGYALPVQCNVKLYEEQIKRIADRGSRPPLPETPSPDVTSDIYEEIANQYEYELPPISNNKSATFVPTPPPSSTAVNNKSEVVTPFCECPNCRASRGETLTTELLPMDTQMTLQNVMEGSPLMCNLL